VKKLNGTYYQNPTFPGAQDESVDTYEVVDDTKLVDTNESEKNIPTPGIDYIPQEQSYIENILRLNKGARAKAYVSFSDSTSWRDKIFDGYIEQAGRDHLIMSVEDGRWFLIPLIYLDYVEFADKIIYRPIELKKNEKNI